MDFDAKIVSAGSDRYEHGRRANKGDCLWNSHSMTIDGPHTDRELNGRHMEQQSTGRLWKSVVLTMTGSCK